MYQVVTHKLLVSLILGSYLKPGVIDRTHLLLISNGLVIWYKLSYLQFG